MTGFETFNATDGYRFRIVSPGGEALCSSPPFDDERARDKAMAALVRMVAAYHLCSVVPDDGSLIAIRYDGMIDIPHQFMQGWAAALRAHIELAYDRRVSVIFLPMGIDLDCLTDKDLASIGLCRSKAESEPVPPSPNVSGGVQGGESE